MTQVKPRSSPLPMDLTYDGPATGSACGATLSLGTRVRSGAGDVCWTSCVGNWIGSDAGGAVAGRGNRVWRRSVCADRALWCVSCHHARLFQTSSTKHRALMKAQVTGPKRVEVSSRRQTSWSVAVARGLPNPSSTCRVSTRRAHAASSDGTQEPGRIQREANAQSPTRRYPRSSRCP